MKVLLATPPVSREERYGSLAGAGSSAPSLGILLLAAAARARGHVCTVVEAAALNLSPEETLERVAAARPEVLGISSTTLSIFHAHALAERAKQLLPELRIVLGGPHVSAAPEETLERFPAFDIAVVGEGEQTLVELLQTPGRDGGSPRRGAGIYWRSAAGACADRRASLPARISTALAVSRLGPARRLSPSATLRPPSRSGSFPPPPWSPPAAAPTPASSAIGRFSAPAATATRPDYVVRHDAEPAPPLRGARIQLRGRYLRHLQSSGCGTICERLIALQADLSWTCLGRVDHVTPENLRLMRSAGCWQISFGIESGSQAILDAIGKGVTLEQIAPGGGLDPAGRDPGQGVLHRRPSRRDPRNPRRTIDFALELPLNDISVTLLTPFPGTELYARAAEFGTLDRDWRRLNLLNAVFVPHGLTAADLLRAQKELNTALLSASRVVADYAGKGAAESADERSVAPRRRVLFEKHLTAARRR